METPQRKGRAITSSFFPVDERLLPQLNITPAQHEELREFAVQAALDAVRDGPTWGRANIEHAVSTGWKVLSARPTACFLIKKSTKKKARKGSKRAAAPAHQQARGPQKHETDKRVVPPPTLQHHVTIPGVTSVGSFHHTDNGRDPMPNHPFASVPLEEAASGLQFMAHAVLPNSLEDVMNTLYCEHTHEMRALKRKVYGEAALDCCVLQTLEGATLDDPLWYLGLKWLALRSPMQALVASREFVYFEHLGTHVDPDTGRRMLYRVMKSVHSRGYGGQDSYFGLTRGHVEAAFVYWMDDENELKNPLLHVCAKGRIHMKGSMPDILVQRCLKAFWRSVCSIFPAYRSGSSLGVTHIDASTGQPLTRASNKTKKKKSRRRKVPSGLPLEMTQDWVADKLRPRCSVCNKKFRLVRRFKHHCRACGEIMCRQCTFHHRVNLRAAHSLRRTVTALADTKADYEHGDMPTDFEETMTCSFDSQAVAKKSKGGDFDASLRLVNARKAVNGFTDTAVLGGDAVVSVMIAKVCLRCLQSVPLVSRSTSNSTQRRRHSEMVPLKERRPASIAEGDGKLYLGTGFSLLSRDWTSEYMAVEEVDRHDGDKARIPGGEVDLPMLVVDDTDAESIDDLAEMKRMPDSNALDTRHASSMYVRPGSYAQKCHGQEDGGLDSHANSERMMIFSPHALSTPSSTTCSQMSELLARGEDSHESSGLSERSSSQHRFSIHSDIDGDDNDSIQFYPTQTNQVLENEELKPAASNNKVNDTNSVGELKDGDRQVAVTVAASTAAVVATEKVLRQMRELQDDALYQNRRIPSPSASTTSLCSEDDDDECIEIDESMRDLRQALAQVESSLTDQAQIFRIMEQERKKEIATSFRFSAGTSSKA